MIGYFDYERSFYENGGKEAVAMDDAIADAAAKEPAPGAPHSEEASAKVIEEFSDKDKILSAEEIIEHRKHCKAKPGNCPFEKARDEADDITPNNIKVTKSTVFMRFAALLTQMFNMSKNLAKPVIAEPEKVLEKSEGSGGEKPTTDEAPSIPTAAAVDDAKIVAEIIESGMEHMVELAKAKGCKVDMDEKKSKYIVEGPKKDMKVETIEKESE